MRSQRFAIETEKGDSIKDESLATTTTTATAIAFEEDCDM